MRGNIMQTEIIKTGFNVWEFRVDGITQHEGSQSECEIAKVAFIKGYIAQARGH